MRHGGSVPDYMIYLQTDDFSGCPKVIFMYGTDECLFAVAPPFEEAMKRYGADYGMIIGEGFSLAFQRPRSVMPDLEKSHL